MRFVLLYGLAVIADALLPPLRSSARQPSFCASYRAHPHPLTCQMLLTSVKPLLFQANRAMIVVVGPFFGVFAIVSLIHCVPVLKRICCCCRRQVSAVAIAFQRRRCIQSQVRASCAAVAVNCVCHTRSMSLLVLHCLAGRCCAHRRWTLA